MMWAPTGRCTGAISRAPATRLLTVIAPDNVAGLDRAWTLRSAARRPGSGRPGAELAGDAHRGRRRDVPFGRRPRGRGPPGDGGRRSGAVRWPAVRPSRRGVAYWPGDDEHEPRILFTTGLELHALAAATGCARGRLRRQRHDRPGHPLQLGTARLRARRRGRRQHPARHHRRHRQRPRLRRAQRRQPVGVRLGGAAGRRRGTTPGRATVGRGGWGANAWPFFFTADVERGPHLPAAGLADSGLLRRRPAGREPLRQLGVVAGRGPRPASTSGTSRPSTTICGTPIRPRRAALFDIPREGRRDSGPRRHHQVRLSVHPEPRDRRADSTASSEREGGGERRAGRGSLSDPADSGEAAADGARPLRGVGPGDGRGHHGGACRGVRGAGRQSRRESTTLDRSRPGSTVPTSSAPRTTLNFPGGVGGPNWGGVSFESGDRPTPSSSRWTSARSAGWSTPRPTDAPSPYEKQTPRPASFEVNLGGVRIALPEGRRGSGQLFAVDVATGDIAWRQDARGSRTRCPPASGIRGARAAPPPLQPRAGCCSSRRPTTTASAPSRRRPAASWWADRLEQRGNADPMTYLGRRTARQYVAIRRDGHDRRLRAAIGTRRGRRDGQRDRDPANRRARRCGVPNRRARRAALAGSAGASCGSSSCRK